MAKTYRPPTASIFPASAEYNAPPPEDRKTIGFHAEKPLTEGSAVTSASTYEQFRSACILLGFLQAAVSNDENLFLKYLPKSAFPLRGPVPSDDWPLFLDLMKGSFESADPPADPVRPVENWKYGTRSPFSYLYYLLYEGYAVGDMIRGYVQSDKISLNLNVLPYVPRLLAADPGAKAFIYHSRRQGSGERIKCYSGGFTSEDESGNPVNPSPTDGDVNGIDTDDRTYADMVDDAFKGDPGSSSLADLDSAAPDEPDYPLVAGTPGTSIAGFHFTFPCRAEQMWLKWLVEWIGKVRCVFGGTMRPSLPSGFIGSAASLRIVPWNWTKGKDGNEPVGWPHEYWTTYVDGEEDRGIGASGMFYCDSKRPGCSGAFLPGPRAPLGYFQDDEADESIRRAVSTTSVFRDVPDDDAVCVAAGDASVPAKFDGWNRYLTLRGFLLVTAIYEEGGRWDLGESEECSTESMAVSDYVQAYIPVSFVPSPDLTDKFREKCGFDEQKDLVGKVLWVPDGSVGNLVANAVDAVTGRGKGGLYAAPHTSKKPPEPVAVLKEPDDIYEDGSCYYTEDTGIHTSIVIGDTLFCPHIVVDGGFFSQYRRID